MPRNTMLKLKDIFEAPQPQAAAEIVDLAAASRHKVSEETADRLGFTGKQREQFIAQSDMLARIMAAKTAHKKQPVMQPQSTRWTMMGQQQQAGGLLFKGPSQK